MDKEIYGVAYPYGEKIVNAGRFDAFVENISEKKSDSVAVASMGYYPIICVVEYSAEKDRYLLTQYTKGTDGSYGRTVFCEAEATIYENSVYIKGENLSLRMPRDEKTTPISIDEHELLSAAHITQKLKNYLGDNRNIEYVGQVEGNGYFGETCEYFYIYTKSPETNDWVLDNSIGISLDFKKVYGCDGIGNKWLYVR